LPFPFFLKKELKLLLHTIPPPYAWLAVPFDPAPLTRPTPILEGLEYPLKIRLPSFFLEISYSIVPSPDR
jgi:hypothetical protein